jgi:eukaryotic-like serine/threonine-protein kinase
MKQAGSNFAQLWPRPADLAVTTLIDVNDEKNSNGALDALFERTPYRPLRRLHGGGMGELVLVEHRELGRVFIAKVLPRQFASDPVLVDRLRLEAQSLGALTHENIVSVVGIDRQSDGRPFFVMERLEGRTLGEELAERGAIPVLEALGHALGVLSALEAAHARGIVHRDVKPDNVFLHRERDGRRVVKLLDFGIARVIPGLGPGSPRPLQIPTETGAIVGTPRFISPEGAAGRKVDHRADLYAVGLLLYTMVAGRGPFDHLNGGKELVSAHAAERPEPPSRLAKEALPPALDAVIVKALEKNPDERFPTAVAFAQELRRVADSLRQRTGWTQTVSFEAPALAQEQPTERVSEPPATGTFETPPVVPPGGEETRTAAPLFDEARPLPPRLPRSRAATLAGQGAVFAVVMLGAGVVGSVFVSALRSAVGAP